MKLTSEDRPIERVNTNPERQFTIKATGKAFRILSSGLYKDKILAIVRELSCNAYDAHISVGKPDVPFDVHLPTPIEPWFAVRDYGPALSPNQIDTVFTTYFESTKTDSNDQIGGLGLGCKSPLSYVDSFAVESIWEGVKRAYTVYFDETDTPSITMMAEEVSEEPTGLMVKVNVKNHDFSTFHRKAADVFRFFPTEPNISGDPSFKINHPTVLLSSPDYILSGGSGQSYAIMGTVVYPLSASSMTGVQLTEIQSRLIDHGGCFIRFSVGDLDITAGREELSYIPLTTSRIIERVNAVLRDMARQTIKKFRACKTEFEARKLYGNFVASSIVGSLFPSAQIPYRGKIINSVNFRFDYKQFSAIKLTSYYQHGNRIKQDIYGMSHTAGESGLNIEAHDGLLFVIDDLDANRTVLSRMRRFIEEDDDDSDIYLIRAYEDEQLTAFLAMVDGVRVKKLSELPKSLPKPRPPVSISQLTDFKAKCATSDIKRNSWTKIDANNCDAGVYVRTKSCIIQYNDQNYSEFSALYQKAKTLNLFDAIKEPLYAIPKSLADQFSEADGWTDYFDYVREAFVTELAKQDWGNRIAKAESMNRFKSTNSLALADLKLIRAIAKKLGAEHSISAFVSLYDACFMPTSFDDHLALARILDVEMIATERFDLVGAWKNFASNYPMFEYVMRASKWNISQDKIVDDVVRYINASDGARAHSSIEVLNEDLIKLNLPMMEQ